MAMNCLHCVHNVFYFNVSVLQAHMSFIGLGGYVRHVSYH